MRWSVAVLVSSVVVYLWGFFFYGLSGIPERTILEIKEEAQVSQQLKEQFPDNGVYFLPSSIHDEKKLQELYRKGPVAIVHMTSVNGREMMDPGILISGFSHIMLTCIALCFLLGLVNNALSGWSSRFVFFLLVGLLVAFYGPIGEAVWWKQSWLFQMANALHDWIAISLAGLVISFIAPSSPCKRAC